MDVAMPKDMSRRTILDKSPDFAGKYPRATPFTVSATIFVEDTQVYSLTPPDPTFDPEFLFRQVSRNKQFRPPRRRVAAHETCDGRIVPSRSGHQLPATSWPRPLRRRRVLSARQRDECVCKLPRRTVRGQICYVSGTMNRHCIARGHVAVKRPNCVRRRAAHEDTRERKSTQRLAEQGDERPYPNEIGTEGKGRSTKKKKEKNPRQDPRVRRGGGEVLDDEDARRGRACTETSVRLSTSGI